MCDACKPLCRGDEMAMPPRSLLEIGDRMAEILLALAIERGRAAAEAWQARRPLGGTRYAGTPVYDAIGPTEYDAIGPTEMDAIGPAAFPPPVGMLGTGE